MTCQDMHYTLYQYTISYGHAHITYIVWGISYRHVCLTKVLLTFRLSESKVWGRIYQGLWPPWSVPVGFDNWAYRSKECSISCCDWLLHIRLVRSTYAMYIYVPVQFWSVSGPSWIMSWEACNLQSLCISEEQSPVIARARMHAVGLSDCSDHSGVSISPQPKRQPAAWIPGLQATHTRSHQCFLIN